MLCFSFTLLSFILCCLLSFNPNLKLMLGEQCCFQSFLFICLFVASTGFCPLCNHSFHHCLALLAFKLWFLCVQSPVQFYFPILFCVFCSCAPLSVLGGLLFLCSSFCALCFPKHFCRLGVLCFFCFRPDGTQTLLFIPSRPFGYDQV